MSATPFSSLFASVFGGAAPVIDDSGAARAARAQKRRSLMESMARFPAPAAQMSFRRQLADLDAQDRAEIGAFGAAKYGRSALKSAASSSVSSSLTSNTKSYSLTDNVKSSPSTSSYSTDSSASVSEDPDLMTSDLSIEDYPAQLDALRAKLRAEKNAARRQRIQTKIQQLLRAQRRAQSNRPASRRAPGSAAAPRVTTEELREKLATLIRRKTKLGEKFRTAKGGKRSDLQQRIQGLNTKIEAIKTRIDRLDTLPPARKGAEIRAISTSLNDASTLARTLEADPSLRYGAEDIPADEGGSAPAEADEAATAPAPAPSAAADITADQPWYRRHAVPLTIAGAGVAIMATLYFTRSGGRKSRE